MADRHDVQLAIHTDGLNEALLAADTARVLAGRTVHLYHIEGVGGGHAPDLLALAGRERLLTSSTNPTVPFGVGAEAEHLAMVAAVHVLEPGTRAGDAAILRQRVRPWTMAAESVLHDLGVIPMLSSDSQGMGRVGETVRRAFQCAAVMKAQRGAGAGAGRQRARPALPGQGHDQPAITHGLAADVGSLRPGRLADLVLWRPELFPVRPELVLKAGMPAWGASGVGGASTMMVEPVRDRPADRRHGRGAGPRLAGLPRRGGDGRRATDDAGAGPGVGLPRPLGRRHGAQRPHGRGGRRSGRPHREPRRRAALVRARGRRPLLGPLPAVKIFQPQRAAVR